MTGFLQLSVGSVKDGSRPAEPETLVTAIALRADAQVRCPPQNILSEEPSGSETGVCRLKNMLSEDLVVKVRK
jgi:hypothetical protein